MEIYVIGKSMQALMLVFLLILMSREIKKGNF